MKNRLVIISAVTLVLFAYTSFALQDHLIQVKNDVYGSSSATFESILLAVESHAISDPELASYIRSNSLNSLEMDSLINTGKLGDESLEALLDIKPSSSGMMHKFFSMFSSAQPSTGELILKKYTLNQRLENKLIMRSDLPKEKADMLKAKLRNELRVKITNETFGNRSQDIRSLRQEMGRSMIENHRNEDSSNKLWRGFK